MTKKQWTPSVAQNWGLFLPPARPSLSELAVIEKYLLAIKKRKRNKMCVAILGSTPEYRDLCQQYNAEYKCIDYNEDNFETLRTFMRYKDSDANLLVHDWRTMKLNKKFDLFIGDLATTVVPVADHEKIFNRIKAHCTRKALVILKTPLRESNKTMSHKQIFQLYREKYFYINPFAAVWHEVLMADYDFKNDTMYCPVSLKKLTESYHKGILNADEFGAFKKRWVALGDFQMNIPLKKEFLKKVSAYFAIEKITSGQDWYKRWSKLIILRNK